MVKIDKYDFPDDLYYTKDRTWAKVEADGKKVRVGLDAFGVELVGKLLSIRMRRAGSIVAQGSPFVNIETSNWVSQLESPVSGTIVEVNQILEKKLAEVNRAPYSQGWFMLIEPTNLQAELKNLLHGDALVEFTKKDIAERGKNTAKQATEFFNLVASRNFTAAEKVLKNIRSKLKRVELNHGYLMALRGMLSATRTNDDRYALMKRLNLSGRAEAERMRRDFIKITKEPLQTEFDRGFFSAWAEFAKALGENDTLRANCLRGGVGNRVKEGPEEEPE